MFAPTRIMWRLLMAIVAVGLAGVPTFAQDGGAPEEPKFVELQQVTAIENPDKKGTWSLKLRGKAPRLPKGTEIEFMVRRSHNDLGSFKTILSGTKKIDETFALDFIEGYVKGVSLKAFIRFELQSPEVQAEIQKHPDDFPMHANPWFQNFQDDPFDLGSEADLKRQKGEIREFFRKTITDLAKTYKKFDDAYKKAADKKDYVKGETLDTEAWRKFVDETIHKRLRELQKEITAAEKRLPFIVNNVNKRDLKYLRNLSGSIARRTVKDSTKLYTSYGLSIALEDAAPKGLDTNARRSYPGPRDFSRLVKRMCDSQGIDQQELK